MSLKNVDLKTYKCWKNDLELNNSIKVEIPKTNQPTNQPTFSLSLSLSLSLISPDTIPRISKIFSRT